jgi:diguanylate cyclase (GGDEF)-like protein/PAS domain S-box-containing protein
LADPVGVEGLAPALRFLALTPDIAAVISFDGHIVRCNPAFERLAGTDPVGEPFLRYVHPDDHAAARAATVRMSDGDGHARVELRLAGEARGWRRHDVTGGSDRDARLVYGIGRDVTEQRNAEAQLAEAEDRFRSAFDNAAIGMTITSLDGIFLRVNQAFAGMLDRRMEDVVGVGVAELTHPEDSVRDVAAMTEMVHGNRDTYRSEKRYLRPDGSPVWADLTATVLRDEEGRPKYFVSQMVDINERKLTVEALRASEDRFRSLANNSSDFLARISPRLTIEYASPAAEALTGYPPEEIVGTNVLKYVVEDDWSLVEKSVQTLQEAESTICAYRARRRDGRIVWFESTITAVRDGAGEIIELVSVSRDVTERKAAELELSHQALHDALTGLPNRVLFLDRLGHALLRRVRKGTGTVAVLFLDVDRFKVVNDSLGHEAGDRLLVDVAGRLDGVLRPDDTVARFGGDEFTILCEDVAGELEAVAIAQRVVELFDEPFELEGSEVFLSTSIGIALAEPGKARPDDLIRDADAAMYRAKERGKARYELFDKAMRAHALERLAVENALRRAVEHDELRLHYQPEIDLCSGEIVGFEALVRWQHPERGLVPPGDFVPLAEETGLIVPIGTWVLREACREAKRWRDSSGHPMGVSVNVSARQLAQPDFVDLVSCVLAETETPRGTLCLEITESAVIERGMATVAMLRSLRDLGVKLAIDDFGTGYSSLGHLRRFPIDILKLDRSFVSGLGQGSQDASIAAAVISLAHALELTTVAEGIETTEQLDVLRGLGSDIGQGFLFARPLPPDEAAALIGRNLLAA